MTLKLNEIYTKHCIFVLIFMPSALAVWNRYIVTKSDTWKLSNFSQLEQKMKDIDCLALCSRTAECESVNHNSYTKSCELLNPGPWLPTEVSETESNWMVYYKGSKKVIALDVWQSSTRSKTTNEGFVAHSADLAVDGNRNNSAWDICAHTDDYQSFWTMEFDREAEVSHVIVYFMNSKQYNYRNSNLRFLISQTREDADNNIGVDCATYIGPPLSPLQPLKITCTIPVTGKFLKIKMDDHHLVLCEVEVFST